MNACVYDKTDKGREEIATRKYRLAPRLRTLLVMINGKNTLETVLRDVAGLGLDEGSVNELVSGDFVRLVGAAHEEATAPARTPVRRVAGKGPLAGSF